MTGEKKFCASHNGEISEAFLTKDNKFLITGGEDGYVRLWDMTSNTPFKEFKYGTFIRDMDINPENTMVALGGDDGYVSIIDLTTKEKAKELKLSEGAVYAVKFDPNGTWLGIGTSSGQVRIWNPATEALLLGATHTSEVYDVSFSADGKYMVSGGADSTARLTKTQAGGEVFALKHGDWVEDTAFGPDSSWFAAASDDNLVHVWDTNTGEEKLRLPHGSYVLRVEVSPDGQWILSTGYDKTARLWDVVSGTLVREMPLDDNGWALAFSPDGKYIFTGDLKGNVIVWDISTLVARTGYIQAPEVVHKVKFSSAEGWFVFNTDDRKLWQMSTDQITSVHDLSSAKEILSLDKITVQLKLSPNSKWAALSLYDADKAKRALLFNIADQTQYYLPHDTDISGLGFSGDSKYLATTNRDGKNVFIWNVETGELADTIPFSEVAFTSAFNPVEINQLVVGQTNGAAIQDITTGKTVARLAQGGDIRSINFSKDAIWLATSSSAGSIYLWDAKNSNYDSPVYEFLQGGGITSIEFSPDLKYLATGSSNGNAYLWDLKTGEEIVRIRHNNPVEGVSFTPDSKLLVTVSRKVIQVWDISKFNPIRKDQLINTACSSLIRNFSTTEWKFFFGGDELRKLCPSLP
jgi:WD40 repeat protein